MCKALRVCLLDQTWVLVTGLLRLRLLVLVVMQIILFCYFCKFCNFYFFLRNSAAIVIELWCCKVFVISFIDLFYLLDCFVNFIGQCCFGNSVLYFFYILKFLYCAFCFVFFFFLLTTVPYWLPLKNAWWCAFRVPSLSCVSCAVKLYKIPVTVARHFVSFLFGIYVLTWVLCTCQLLILWLALRLLVKTFYVRNTLSVSRYVCKHTLQLDLSSHPRLPFYVCVRRAL